MAKYSGAKKYKANVVNLTSKNEYEAEQFASFFSDSYGYLDDEIIRYNASDYDTTRKNYEDFQTSSSSWKKRADSAKRYVEQHKDLFGEDYQSYTDYIDAFSKELDSVGTNYKARTSFFSSFSTKDEYDYWEKASELDIEAELKKLKEKEAQKNEKSQSNAPAVLIPEDHPNYNSVISALESKGVNSVIEQSNEWTFDEAIQKKEKQQSEALLDYARDIQYGQKFSQLTEDQKKDLLVVPGYKSTNEKGEEVIAPVSPDEWEWLQDPVNYDSILSDREADNIAREKRINQAILPPEMQLKNGDDSYLNYYDTLQSIKQTKEFTAENPFLANVGSVLSSPIKAVGAVSGAVQGLFGEVDPYSDSFRINHMINAVREETSKNMGGAGAFIYNTGMSILENGFNMLISGGNPAVIGVLMGSQVASDTIMDAKTRGLSDLQALSLGGIAGIAEALFEKFSLGNLKQLAQNGGAGIKNFVKNWLKQAGVEASEEFFTEISNILTDEIISGDLSAYNLAINEALKRGLSYEEAVSNANKGLAKQIGEATAGGFISGGVFGFVGNAYNVAQNRAVGKELSSAKRIDSTIEQARQYENPSDELTARLKDFDSKKNPSASYAGAVYRAMARESYGNLNATVKKEINSFVSQQLSESGIEANDKLVSAVAKKIYGSEKLTRAETKLIESEGVSNVIEKISKNKKLKSTPFQTEAFLKADQTARDVEKLGVDAVIRNAAMKKYNVTENAAEIESIDVKDNGDVYIKQNGNVVEAEKAGVNPDTALALHYGEAMSPAKKREYFAHYNDYVGEGKMSLDDYHNYFDLAYTYGQVAKGIDNAQNELKGTLSDEDIFTIYKSGLETRRSASEKLSEQSKELQKALGIQDRTPGRVDDSLIRYGKIRSAERRAMIGFANVLATTTGRNIKFFDSTSKLRKENFPNGYYNPKTNTIYLDVNAGMLRVMREDQSAILSTLSHELVHIFRKEDFNGFTKLKEVVLDTLSKEEGKSVKTLIDAEVRKIQESDPKRFVGKSLEQQRDIASEELVARACENMLAESRLMKEFIQQLESKESGLAQRFSNMLGRAIEKLKEIFEKIFKNQQSNSKEAMQIAKARKDMVDRWNAIKEQYDALLERRADTQAKENTSQGEVMMSERYDVAIDKLDAGKLDRNINQLSESFTDNLLDRFGIEKRKLGDYVHVQNHVFDTLMKEGFFTDKTLRNRTDVNKESGMVVEINKSSIDETFSFNNFVRLGKFKKIAKLATIRELPNVIKYGHMVADDVANKYANSENKKFAYIEYATEVDGKEIVVRIAIKKSPQKNKFWVHSIYTIENVSDSPASTNRGTEAGHITADTNERLPHSPESVKTQFDKLLERNIGIEPAQENTSDNSGIQYQARNGNVKDAQKLSEEDFRFLLEQSQNGEFADDTYIPLRATTPSFFIDVVREHTQGKINVLQVPLASQVEHVRQNMEEDDGSSYGDKRPHNLSDEDMVMIAKEMGHPSYIVKQYNGRYAMVVSFYNKQNKKVIVSIDFAVDSENPKNYKYEQYMNGYNEGFYNVVVTQYQPDSMLAYLQKNEVVYDKQKMNGKYQVGSGRIVTFTHDTPFINNSIPNSPESVKENDSNGVMFMSRGETESIKNQIRSVESKLNNMDVVSSVQTDGFKGMEKSEIAKLIDSEYAKFGNRVDRQNFGIVLLEYNQINKALNYLDKDGEKAALLTVPRVLKRGIIADQHIEHKGRGIDSITFAAPVEINGIRGNVGVVVQRDGKTNRFKTLRILLPNGKAFEFAKNKEADNATGGSLESSKESRGAPIESASKDSIPNSAESVKENDSNGVMKQERSVAQRRKNTYNEFNTNAMQWANSSSRNQNDVKVLYDPRRKQYYLIGVSQDSDMGFIELNSGTRKEMEYERDFYTSELNLLDSGKEEFDEVVQTSKAGTRDNSWHYVLAGQQGESYSNGGFSSNTVRQGEQASNGAGDFAGTETDSRGVSYQERSPQKYSYEALTSKPDMKVTVIEDTVNYQPNKQTRKDVVNAALKNASRVGKQNKDGSVLVPVKDTGLDILIGRNGLKHGLDRRMNQNAAVTLKAGEILKNSVCINELLPDKENVSNSYVLIGVAKNSHSEAYVVEFLVNRYTNELTSIDVLYSANTKKESAAHNAPEITENPLLTTDSVISIADLLDYVNRYFPDVLPESVLRHYGHEFRPEGKLGNSTLYQDRTPYPRRTYWAPDMNESERRYVRSVAKNEAYKTDNYLDGITKWLYYEKNDNSYFALYSTDDTLPEPTILYACKGEKAKHEQGYVIDYFSKENQYGKGNDPESRIVNGIFVANKNSSDIGIADRGESLGRGSDDRTSSTHSKNERKRPSKALRNCLANLEEIREHRESERINSDDSKIMYQDRAPYRSARDILVSYAEDAKNVKARSKYLDEYVERSNALDRKYRRLEDAESRLAEAISQGNEEKIALYTKRAKTKQREIHRLNEDLRAMEESKELKAIVSREKAATKRQANAEQRAALHNYRDELERKARTERIMAKTKLLSKKLIANNRENHVPDALKEPLTRFLTALEYHSPRSKRGGDLTQKERSFSFLLDDVSDALRESSAYQSQNGKMVISEDVYDEIKALCKALRDAAPASDKYVLDEMTSSELQLLDRVMTKIVHGLNSIDRAFASSGRQEIDAEGKETMAFLDKMEDQKGSDYKNAAQNEKKKLTWHGLAKFLTWEQFTPATAFNRLGEAGKRIYRRIVEGWGEYAYLAKKILKFSEENWKNNAKPFSKNTHEIRANGKVYAISDAQLMYLYLADQREQGRNHLDGDGFMMPGNVDTAESDKIHMSAEARQALYDKYIPEGSEARELAGKIQKFLSENCAAWGNEVTLALYGYTAFTDENYVPLITDISGKRISGNLPVTNELYRILNMGFTKSLDPKAKNALIAMDIFDVFAKHAADMAKYKALGKPVLDAVRFFGYKETEVDPIRGKPHDRTLQSRIRQVYGEESYKYFTKFLEDLNGENPKSAAGLLGKTSTWFLKNYKLAAIGFSFKTIVLQFTSYFRASYVLSGKSMTKAVTLLSRTEKKLLDNDKTKKYSELAQQYSGMAAWKSLGYYDVNITRSLTEQIKGDATRTEKIAEKATAGMGKADEKTLGVLFKACCIEVIRTIDVTGLTKEDIYRKAGELLDEVIVKTQVVDSVVTRSQAMRGDDGLEKSLTSFMSEPTVAYNVLIDAVFDVAEKKKQGKPLPDAIKSQGRTIKKALISYAITSVVAAMVESAFDAWRDDEDEELWERWWNHLGGNVIENISVIGKLPFLRDGIAFLTTVGGGYANTDRMEYAAFTEITNVIKKGVKLWQDDHVTYHDVYGFIKSLTSAASYSTSIPLQNGLRKVEDLWNNTFGDWYDMKLTTQEPSFGKQYDSAFNRGKAKAEISELVGAKAKEYVKKYPEEKESAIRKKAESSVQSSLTRYYKPLYLKAWEDGDREEMERIRSALRQSGLYEDLDKKLQNWIE